MWCVKRILDARQSEVDGRMVETRLERQAGAEEKKNLRILGCEIVGDDEKLLGGRTEPASSE